MSWLMTHEFDLDQLDNVDVWYLSLGGHIQEENSHSYNDQKKLRDFTFIFLLEYLLINDSFFCGDTFGSEVSPASREFELSQSNKEL